MSRRDAFVLKTNIHVSKKGPCKRCVGPFFSARPFRCATGLVGERPDDVVHDLLELEHGGLHIHRRFRTVQNQVHGLVVEPLGQAREPAVETNHVLGNVDALLFGLVETKCRDELVHDLREPLRGLLGLEVRSVGEDHDMTRGPLLDDNTRVMVGVLSVQQNWRDLP